LTLSLSLKREIAPINQEMNHKNSFFREPQRESIQLGSRLLQQIDFFSFYINMNKSHLNTHHLCNLWNFLLCHLAPK